MFTMNDLKPHFNNESIVLCGSTFSLWCDHTLGGDIAVWSNDKLEIRATPNYDNVAVPVSIEDMDWLHIDDDDYRGDINSFEEYKNKVKELAKPLIMKYLWSLIK